MWHNHTDGEVMPTSANTIAVWASQQALTAVDCQSWELQKADSQIPRDERVNTFLDPYPTT